MKAFTHASIKVFFYLSFCFTTFSQSRITRSFEVFNNSSSSTLLKVLHKDHDGFIWYSTYNGVVKQTTEQTLFFPYDDHPTQKEVRTTYAILKTRENILWASTKNGVFKLNLSNGKKDWFMVDQFQRFIEEGVAITSIYEDSSGTIWFGTNKSCIYTINREGQIIAHKIDTSVSMDNYHHLRSRIVAPLANEAFLVSLGNNWFRFENNVFHPLLELDNTLSINNSYTTICLKTSPFPKKDHGYFQYQGKTLSYWYFEKENRFILQVPYNFDHLHQKKIAKGLIWKRSKNLIEGLTPMRIDDQNFLITEHTIKIKALAYVIDKDETLYTINEDHVTVTDLKPTPFKVPEFPPHLYPVSTRAIKKDRFGNMYISSYRGFFKRDSDDGIFELLPFKNPLADNKESLLGYGYGFELINDTIMLAYGYSSKLLQANLKTNNYFFIDTGADFPSISTHIKDMEPLGKKNYLVGGSNGLFKFNYETKEFSNWEVLENYKFLEKIDVSDIFISKKNNTLWLGTTSEGLYALNLSSNKLIHFSNGNKNLPLAHNSVRCIYEGENGIIWIGTENGLQRIDPSTNHSENISSNLHFKNSHIVSILESDDYLWLGTYEGLVKYNKIYKTINDFHKFDGISNEEFNAKSFYRENSSTFYFGSINGITQFNPKKIDTNSYESKLYLTEAIQYNKDTKDNHRYRFGLDTITQFKIPYAQNYLTLLFSINDRVFSKKRLYKYRISELQNNWNTLDRGAASIRLQGLKPGDYTLEILGFNSRGNPTNNLTYKLQIQQIFYKSGWFLILINLLAIILILTWVFIHRATLKREFSLKYTHAKLESNLLKARMNPHFIFNSLNGIQSVMFLEGELEANKYLDAFSKLLRLTLDMTDLDYIPLDVEIQYISSYLKLEQMRLDGELTVCIDVEENLDTEKIKIPPMFIQPIVENAIVHGLKPKKEDRNITIGIYQRDYRHLKIEVIDNGIGRAEATLKKNNFKEQHNSSATKIMNERIKISNSIFKEQLNFKIEDLNQEGRPNGTKVTLIIPFTRISNPK